MATDYKIIAGYVRQCTTAFVGDKCRNPSKWKATAPGSLGYVQWKRHSLKSNENQQIDKNECSDGILAMVTWSNFDEIFQRCNLMGIQSNLCFFVILQHFCFLLITDLFYLVLYILDLWYVDANAPLFLNVMHISFFIN